MDLNERIEQFEKMANDDPDNELGHFSLGKAYLDAGRPDDAVTAFKRVLWLNDSFSKAYQHLAEAELKLARTDDAAATLTTGYEVAAKRGDVMPREAMAKMLQDMGRSVPEVQVEKAATPEVGAGEVQCCRCGRAGPRLPERPFKGDLGEKVLENVCQPCWQEWLTMGTKVINELRLDFSNPAASEIYDSHMMEFLQLQ